MFRVQPSIWGWDGGTDSAPSRTGKSRIIPFTLYYPLSLRKKNSTVVWIPYLMCERFRVWFPGAEPSPLPLQDKIFEQNYQNDIFHSSFVNGLWCLWDVHCAPNIGGFYYINKNSAMRQSLITFTSFTSLHIVCSFLTIHRVSHLKKYHAHRLKVMKFFLLIPLNVINSLYHLYDPFTFVKTSQYHR